MKHKNTLLIKIKKENSTIVFLTNFELKFVNSNNLIVFWL